MDFVYYFFTPKRTHGVRGKKWPNDPEGNFKYLQFSSWIFSAEEKWLRRN